MSQHFSRAIWVLGASLLAACKTGTARPPGADEVRWDIQSSGESGYCPDQELYLPKLQTLNVDDPASSGLICDNQGPVCPRAPADWLGNGPTVYTYRSDQLELQIVFNNEITLGYSEDNFRKDLESNGHSVTWWVTPNGAKAAGRLTFQDSEPTIEIISYQAPILHVRVHAQGAQVVVIEPATSSFVCVTGSPIGTPNGLGVCTEAGCSYSDGGSGPTQLLADLAVPVQPLAP